MMVARILGEQSSLRARTVAFIAVVALVLAVLDIQQAIVSYHARLAQAQRETENLARSLSLHIQDVFAGVDAAMIGMRDQYLSDGANSHGIPRLERAMRLRVPIHQMHGFLILDEHGNWVASALTPEQAEPFRTMSFAGRDFFKDLQSHPGDGLTIFLPSVSQRDGTRVITVARRIDKPDGSFGGVIVGSIAPAVFQDFFATLSLGRYGSVGLTTDQGTIIVRQPYQAGIVGRNVAPAGLFQSIDDAAAAGHGEFRSAVDGRTRIGSFQRIPGLKIVVFVALDEHEVLAPWRRAMWDHVLWLAMALLPVGFMGYLLSGQMRRLARAEHELALSHRTLERRVAERTSELQLASDRAEQASRAKSAFLNMVSHELRTPLTQLELQIGMHRRLFRDKLSARQEQALANISSAMQRLSRLVDGVLDYSRIKSERLRVKPGEFDVAELVGNACADIAVQADRCGLAVEFQAECPVITMVSDSMLVGIVVHNLLDNAVKYTPEGCISVRVAAAGAMVSIEVADTGIGIPADIQARIFEPFEQAEEVDRKHLPGVGLGLALVKDITDLLGGTIHLTSEVGRGSLFVLVLPCVLEPGPNLEGKHALDSHRGRR